LVGIARNPRTVKRSISKKKFIKRTGVKSFIKVVNQNHVIPTRFVVNDFDLKEVKEENVKTVEQRATLAKQWKTQFSTSYRNLPDIKTNEKAPHVRFFFSKLRF
jgi:large subunit ribosomal protein L27e